MAGLALLDHFSALEDPRQPGKVLYPLPEVMLLVLCATLAGAEDFVEARLWGREKLAFLRSLLPFRRGIPSHDTLNDVVNALDPDLFGACFVAWVEGLREDEPDIVAVDGKTSRRARRGQDHPLHVVSAWAARQRLVLGQQAVGSKSNEIIAIPLLLERLRLTGALVTIDAMGCQTRIAQTILDRGADYLLALKDNQPSLADEVALFFQTPEAQAASAFETIDADHGRIETRNHRVSHNVDWLTTDRRFPGEPRFPASRSSPWSRPPSNATAPSPPHAATSSPPCRSIPAPSPALSGPIGASRTDCTGCWTSSSTTTSCACGPIMARRTWPPSNTWP